MRQLVLFTLWTNALAIALIALTRLISPTIADWKLIDLMFLTGVFFWFLSTVVRLSNKRIKKEWNKTEMSLTDPQLVISSDSLATRLLIAGLPALLGSLIWGFFY